MTFQITSEPPVSPTPTMPSGNALKNGNRKNSQNSAKRKYQGQRKWHKSMSTGRRTLFISIAFAGIGLSAFGVWAMLFHSRHPALLSDGRWIILLCGIILFALALAWLGREMPRIYGLLKELRRVNSREIALREQLQSAYDEQEILVQQQQELLSEVDRLYREQAQAAVTDTITSLPNHRAIISRLDEEIARCQRTHRPCGVLFIDLDHFKRINDTWGHRAGDAILTEVGTRLRLSLRQQDFVGRYGGEEFALVLADLDITGAQQAAERVRTIISEQAYLWQADDTTPAVEIDVTASIGVAIYQLHGSTREVLVESADQAMYQAKQRGRNCVCISDFGATPAQKNCPADEATSAKSQRIAPTPTAVVPVQTVQAFTALASAHDRGTDAHSHRMIQLAEGTARMLGEPEEELHLIRLGALLHDIGKIGIPDTILHKPGPLTSDEWTVMRRHPEIGYQVLEQVGGVFCDLAHMVVAHHERWDGKGYPKGLAGTEIPIGARILSVVDSYDAMTSRRAYREPMSVPEARIELQRCSGTQYDPQVVTAFLHMLEEQEEAKVQVTVQEPALP